MKILSHSISVPRTAHYATLGEAGPNVKYFWIACHGYGQLAKSFIRNFEPIAADDTFILAPEGLSRFYWGGFTGNVVASWMTREDRLDEISDYSNYLSLLFDQYSRQLPDEVRVILLGFSQGCATQMRWVMRAFPHFDQLIFWAGSIPEDIDYRPHLDYFADKQLHFFYGLQDPFLTPDRTDAQRQMVKSNGLKIREHTFDGKHIIDEEPLRQIDMAIRTGNAGL